MDTSCVVHDDQTDKEQTDQDLLFAKMFYQMSLDCLQNET